MLMATEACYLKKGFPIKHNLQTTKAKGNNITNKIETTHTIESRLTPTVITKYHCTRNEVFH